MKSFMEELRDSQNASSTAAAHVVAGATFKNPGGRGVKKGCARCRLAGRDPTGHRKRNCPFNANSETDAEIKARRKAAKRLAAEAEKEQKEDEASRPKERKAKKRKADSDDTGKRAKMRADDALTGKGAAEGGDYGEPEASSGEQNKPGGETPQAQCVTISSP